MPCHYPIQGYLLADGFKLSKRLQSLFSRGADLSAHVLLLDSGEAVLPSCVPCGRCMFCKLEKSRQVGLRSVHESKMFDDNCFVTLTFNSKFLDLLCPMTSGGYSLSRQPAQLFVKRLREKFRRGFDWIGRDGKLCSYGSSKVRVFGCGEYGEPSVQNGFIARPHYHFCFFNCCFPDRVKFKKINGFWSYTSDILSSLWSVDGEPIGHAVVGDFSFETGAYVARYCTKKITGDKALLHYKGRLPEFSIYPTSGGGIGKSWFENFALTDIFPTDSCVVRGVKCKVPRYYNDLWKRYYPESFAKAKQSRRKAAALLADDNSFSRLRVKEKCMDSRIRSLVRNLEF